MARGKTNAGKKTLPSASIATAVAGGLDAAEVKVRGECSKAFELFTKKGNLGKASKDLDKLVGAHASNPLVRFARVRLAHCDALDQKRPDPVRKKFDEAKALAAAACAACPGSLTLLAMRMQVHIDYPIHDAQQAQGEIEDMDNVVKEVVKKLEADDAETRAKGENGVLGNANALSALAVTFIAERKAVQELDKDAHSMYVFPRVKGKCSISFEVYDRTLRRLLIQGQAAQQKIQLHRSALNEASKAQKPGADGSEEDTFVAFYVKLRDSERKRYREDGDDPAEAQEAEFHAKVKARAAAQQEQELGLAASVKRAQREQPERQTALTLGFTDASVTMEVDGAVDVSGAASNALPVARVAEKNVALQAKKPQAKTASQPWSGDKTKKVEKKPSALPAVKKFWKARVASDPVATVLRLTDVPVSELRVYVEKEKATVKDTVRGEITKCVENGRWRAWRCGRTETSCDENGIHSTEESCFLCVQKQAPREVLREQSGDAQAWLSPISLASDIVGLGLSSSNDALLDSTLAASKKAETLLHETSEGGLVSHGEFTPTPGSLALSVSGRPSPLLSADTNVLREASTGDDETKIFQLLKPEDAKNPKSAEYEFGDQRLDDSLLTRDEILVRQVRVDAFNDALRLLRVKGPAAVDALREHVMNPSVLPPVKLGDGEAPVLEFLEPHPIGFTFAEEHESMRLGGFLPKAEDWKHDLGDYGQAQQDVVTPAQALKVYAGKARSVREKLLALPQVSGGATSEKVSAAYALITSELAPVEDPEFVPTDLLPSFGSSKPPSSEETLLEDILTTLRITANALALPLRAVQAVARYVSAIESKRGATEDTGMRRCRRALGSPERVESGSPETKDAVNRPSFVSEEENGAHLPVRLDDLVGRLKKLAADDLKPVWDFCKDVLFEGQIGHRLFPSTFKAEGLMRRDPGALSMTSPLFSMTTGGAVDERQQRVDETKSDHVKSKKKGKGGQKASGSGKTSAGTEWVPNEQTLRLRVSTGVWRELYGETQIDTTDTKECFFGERLLNWLFHDSGVGGEPAGDLNKTLDDEDGRVKKLETVLAKLETHETLFQDLMEMKLKLRGFVDQVLVIASRLLTEAPLVPPRFTGRAFADLDFTSEADREKFVTFWRRHAFLTFHTLELRKNLMNLDIVDLLDDEHALTLKSQHIKDDFSVLDNLKMKITVEREHAERASKRLDAKKKSDAWQKLFQEKQEERKEQEQEITHDMRDLREKHKQLLERDMPEVNAALCVKSEVLQELEKSERNSDVVTTTADDGSYLRKCSPAMEEIITHQVESWIQKDGDLPAATLEIAESVSRIPFRVSHLLWLAQERILKLDLQMEFLLGQRVQATAFAAESLTIAHSQKLGSVATQTTVLGFIRDRLEHQAAEFAAEEAVREQELLLEEEGLDAEAKRLKEEKAKAKKAKEKAIAKEAKEMAAEDEARAATAVAEQAAAAEAKVAAKREAEEAQKAAAKREAQAAEDAALETRRVQILREQAQRQETEHNAMLDAKRASAMGMGTGVPHTTEYTQHSVFTASSPTAKSEQDAALRAGARSKVARAAEAERAAFALAADAERSLAAANEFTPRTRHGQHPSPVYPIEAHGQFPHGPGSPPLPHPHPHAFQTHAAWGTPQYPHPPSSHGSLSPPSSPGVFTADAKAAEAAHWEAQMRASSAAFQHAQMMAAQAAAAHEASARAAAAARAELAAVDSAPPPFTDTPESWPTLAPQAPDPVVEEPVDDVDDHGFAIDDLEAALRASMTETKGRPKTPGPELESDFDETLDDLVNGTRGGLRNLEGEYNCFLNVVIQSLWHLDSFHSAMRAFETSTKAKQVDADVVIALRDVFQSLDSARDSTEVTAAAAPTALRKALSALTDTGVEDSLFKENEMADASEALQAIFHAVHRACEPDTVPKPKPKPVAKTTTSDPKNIRGAFLDDECSYLSSAHTCFGLDIEERVECITCNLQTHNLRYTKFLHLLPVMALNETCEEGEPSGENGSTNDKIEKGKTSTAKAIKIIDALDFKSCDSNLGGCGVRFPTTHALSGRTPDVFVLALTWSTANANAETVTKTLGNLDDQIDLAVAFDAVRVSRGEEVNGLKYKLQCVLCYYGEHYCTFARGAVGEDNNETDVSGVVTQGTSAEDNESNDKSTDERWTLFDDATSKTVGTWADVKASCEKGRLQPCVLFYQRE